MKRSSPRPGSWLLILAVGSVVGYATADAAPSAPTPPPEVPSEAPSASDWLKAPIAASVRVTDPSCTAKRMREWYRVECRGRHASLVTGERRDVKFGHSESEYTVWAIFPAKRGDVRVILLSRLSKWSIAPNAIVSEQWLEGDPAPLITVIGIPD